MILFPEVRLKKPVYVVKHLWQEKPYLIFTGEVLYFDNRLKKIIKNFQWLSLKKNLNINISKNHCLKKTLLFQKVNTIKWWFLCWIFLRLLYLVSAKDQIVTDKTQNRPKTQLTFRLTVFYVVFVRFFGKFVENGEV